MEKKKYEELELEVVRLDGSDVITASSEEACWKFAGSISCDGYDPIVD